MNQPIHTSVPTVETVTHPMLRIWVERLGLSLLLLLAVALFSLIPVVRDSELRVTDTFFPPGAQACTTLPNSACLDR